MSSTSGRTGAVGGIADSSDPRFKTSRRDDAIRRKVEADLSRKAAASVAPGGPPSPSPAPPGRHAPRRRGSRRHGSLAAVQAAADGRASVGTVQNLRPIPALTVPQSISVADASQLCAAKRTDCVLVVDDDEHLAGIFTAKDLAFRVVAAGWDPRMTPVSAIMTRNPVVTRDSTSATEALDLMVSRGFRHLPVCNDDGDVVGLLDIARVFYGALTKLERAHSSSQKLYAALEGVQTEWGAPSAQQLQLLEYIDTLRTRLAFPDLASVLDARTVPTTVSVRTTVREAARLMKQHRVTAVCVMDTTSMSAAYQTRGVTSGKVAGIFTSKDVVLRVIAAGLDPRTCSVVRVMTPHPDTAAPTLSIQAALRKMHDGHYLNLPVVDDEARLVGVVDVLRLTWKTLEQINSMNEDAAGDISAGDGASVSSSKGEAGPMWNRFWNSFAHTGSYVGEDTEEQGDESMSISASGMSNSISHRHGRVDPAPSRIPRPASRTSSAASGSRPNGRASPALNAYRSSTGTTGPETPGNETGTDLYPGDSASAVGSRRDAAVRAGNSSLSRPGGPAMDPVAALAASSGAAAGEDAFLFKFSTPSRRTHRFAAPVGDVSALRSAIVSRLEADEFCRGTADDGVPDASDFALAYEDDEKDMVVITSDADVREAVRIARATGTGRVLLCLQGGASWETQLASARAARSTRRDTISKEVALTAVAEEDEHMAAPSSYTRSQRSASPSSVPSVSRQRGGSGSSSALDRLRPLTRDAKSHREEGGFRSADEGSDPDGEKDSSPGSSSNSGDSRHHSGEEGSGVEEGEREGGDEDEDEDEDEEAGLGDEDEQVGSGGGDPARSRMRRRKDTKQRHRHHNRRRAHGAGVEDDMLLGILPKDMALPAAIGFLGVALLVTVVMARPQNK